MTRRPRGELSDVGDIQAGGDTTRVHLSPDAEAYRARQRADARANLAAMIFAAAGVDPVTTLQPTPAARAAVAKWLEIAGPLGLQVEPTRLPGRCDCGAPLADPGTGYARRERRRRGLCVACARAAGRAL